MYLRTCWGRSGDIYWNFKTLHHMFPTLLVRHIWFRSKVEWIMQKQFLVIFVQIWKKIFTHLGVAFGVISCTHSVIKLYSHNCWQKINVKLTQEYYEKWISNVLSVSLCTTKMIPGVMFIRLEDGNNIKWFMGLTAIEQWVCAWSSNAYFKRNY